MLFEQPTHGNIQEIHLSENIDDIELIIYFTNWLLKLLNARPVRLTAKGVEHRFDLAGQESEDIEGTWHYFIVIIIHQNLVR